MSKYLIYCRELMKQGTKNGLNLVNVTVDQMQVSLNSKQRWNNDKCRCECKEVIGKGISDKVFALDCQ